MWAQEMFLAFCLTTSRLLYSEQARLLAKVKSAKQVSSWSIQHSINLLHGWNDLYHTAVCWFKSRQARAQLAPVPCESDQHRGSPSDVGGTDSEPVA